MKLGTLDCRAFNYADFHSTCLRIWWETAGSCRPRDYKDECRPNSITSFSTSGLLLLCLLISLFIILRRSRLAHPWHGLDAILAMSLIHMLFPSLLCALILYGSWRHIVVLDDKYYTYAVSYDNAYTATFVVESLPSALHFFYALLISFNEYSA